MAATFISYIIKLHQQAQWSHYNAHAIRRAHGNVIIASIFFGQRRRKATTAKQGKILCIYGQEMNVELL